VRSAPRLTHARRSKRLQHNVNGVCGDDSGRYRCSYPHPENLTPLLSEIDTVLPLGENTMTMPLVPRGNPTAGERSRPSPRRIPT